MSAFLVAILLVVAFMAGSAMALRPSPRQRQLARLRERAVACRLRVQWQPGGQSVDYLLPWDADVAGRARAVRFDVTRGPGGGWLDASGTDAPLDETCPALARLPVSVSRVRALPEGMAACWAEAGADSTVDEIALSLRELAGALLSRN